MSLRVTVYDGLFEALTRITPVRDLIPLVISRALAALFVVCQGPVASSFAS
jgi:hypothetical protein